MDLIKKLLRWSSIGMGVLFGLYVIAALVMVALPAPNLSASKETVSVEELIAAGVPIEQVYESQEVTFTMRDGTNLSAQYFPAESETVVLMIHGVTGSSMELNQPAGQIREATGAAVYALDLRGHGRSGGEPGDIDYIGQYEDDLADTIATLRSEYPDHKLVVAGYSMGGAVVLRQAALDNEAVDATLLIAPNLGADAPTARTETSDLPPDVEPFLALHIPRIIGIALIDGMGLRVFNGLPVMFFNLPAPYTNTYSYRAMMNSSADNYQNGFEAIDQPLLVVVGSADETMEAQAFPDLVGAYSDGEVQIIDGANHQGVLYHPELIEVVSTWMQSQ